eukprot:243253-Rhodomonas_salina.1
MLNLNIATLLIRLYTPSIPLFELLFQTAEVRVFNVTVMTTLLAIAGCSGPSAGVLKNARRSTFN